MVTPIEPDLALAFKRPVSIARPLRRWRGFAAEHVVVGDEPYAFERAGTSHFLALHDLVIEDGEVTVDGLDTSRRKDVRNTLTFIPEGLAASGWTAPARRRNTFTALYFDPRQVSDELERRYVERPPPPTLFVRNAALEGTLGKIEAILTEPVVDDLLAESLCLLAALEVFAIQADPEVGLSDRHVATIADYVDAHLAAAISLDDLATLCGLSRFHFARAFKKATGTSPYAYVLGRRIDRALGLLDGGDLGIEEIARLVGFPSSSQFRRAFRLRMGCSAQAYRQRSR